MVNSDVKWPVGLAGMALIGVAFASSGFDPAMAQTAPGQSGSAPICMKRTIESGATLYVLLPGSDRKAMRDKGFRLTRCREAFGSRAARHAWRDEICELASLPLDGVQQAYSDRWGVRPQTLCGMAEAATERWQRKRG
ncbi:hypothetical protein INR77_05920 [Erythrobacter sp. SCSIO 43205]|uniref:hypothetical protein n=1 Tax=Erythrobacter sp. SCSIO 43205 TaxID=2779361 RepID=UPI001CAA3A1C|nr:hypothetical protein [Erythrobacter sp. SCSIO 43205]UAB79216.1 hypothetical protein INR77_05920 [Erythrobacter sp. SCSIO 43205]